MKTIILLLITTSICLVSTLANARAQTIGIATVINSNVSCPTGSISGEACVQIQVSSCTNTDDIVATIGVVTPTSPIGTIILHSGKTGTSFYNNSWVSALLAANYRVVQIAWATEWENTGPTHMGNIMSAACRPATAFDWIYRTYHLSDKTKPFALFGASGGSGAIGYAMTHYNLGSEVDTFLLAGGPPWGDILNGCTASNTMTQTVCPGFQGKIAYPFNFAEVNRTEHTTTCQNTPSTADEVVWAAGGIDSVGAVYNYPQTVGGSFQCPFFNMIPGNGMYWLNNVTSRIDSFCDGGCPAEYYGYNQTNFNQMFNWLITNNIPRH